MKEFNEKMKKEYSAPQMDVMDCKVEGFLCNSDPGDTGDVIVDND